MYYIALFLFYVLHFFLQNSYSVSIDNSGQIKVTFPKSNLDLESKYNHDFYKDIENLFPKLDLDLSLKHEYKVSFNKKNKIIFEIEANLNTDKDFSDLYIFYYQNKSKFGNIEIGNQESIYKKTSLVNYRFDEYIKHIKNTNIGSNLGNLNFILFPSLPINHSGYGFFSYRQDGGSNKKDNLFNSQIGDMNNNLKINYFSPRKYNFKISTSFTPSVDNEFINNKIKNIINFGVNYVKYVDNVGVALSFNGEIGKSYNHRFNNLKAYELSFALTYMGFTFISSYGNWHKSLLLKNYNNRSNFYNYYDLDYEIGPFNININHFKSYFLKGKNYSNSLLIKYKLAKQLSAFMEVTEFSFKEKNIKLYDNDISIIFGMKFTY